MIKQSLLDSLKGLSLKDAGDKVLAAGHTPQQVPETGATILQLWPNTVILWYSGDVVKLASAGDGSELDENA